MKNLENEASEITLGLRFDNEEQLETALDQFSTDNIDVSKLPQFNDDVVEGLYAFAYGYYNKARYAEAESLFRVLTAVRLRDIRFWKGFGAVLQMLKKYDQAVEAYSWAAVFDEKFDDPYPHFHAAECLYSLGQIPRGLKALHSAKTIAQTKGTYAGLLSQIALLQEAWRKKKS